MIVWMIANMANAGVLPEGAQNIYTGVSFGTWSAFESNGNTIPVSKQDDLSVMQVLNDTQVTYGIQAGLDVTYVVPISYVKVPGKQGGALEPTLGLGQIGASVQQEFWRFDQTALTGSAGLFTGLLHAGTRDRLTNIGDGSTQVRLGLEAEDVREIGLGFIHFNAKGQYIAKLPSNFSFDPKYPADDVTYTVTLGGGYRGYSMSVFVDGFQRLSGVNYSESNTVDPKERFTALKASQMKVGISDAIALQDGWSLSGYVAHSVMAKNNPMDEWISGIGVSYYKAP